MASSLLGAVQGARRVQGLASNPANNTAKDLVKLKGPGLFISAQVTKQGGNSDITFIELYIDGQDIVSVSLAGLFNWGMTEQNTYGLHVTRSAVGIETVTIGYPVPLTFNKELLLRAVVRETGVVQILGNVICTTEALPGAIAIPRKIKAAVKKKK